MEVEGMEAGLIKAVLEQNLTIFDAFAKLEDVLPRYRKVLVSISGGADSDVMLDMVMRERSIDRSRLSFAFFDTGIEYEATKRHLVALEERYGIAIDRVRASVPVPLGCRKEGMPFLSKFASEMIGRLQKKGFDFRGDGMKPFEELAEMYPGCLSALRWWCDENGKGSRFGISRFKWLKEFMVTNPPAFRISQECCKGAKKDTASSYVKGQGFDLVLVGLRRSENGIRSQRIAGCLTKGETSQF